MEASQCGARDGTFDTLAFFLLIGLYLRPQICDAGVADQSGKTVFCV